MSTKVRLFFSVFMMLLISSCFKNEEYPVEPIISNPSFVFYADSARLSFDFTDGDGDLGLNQDEVQAPYNPESYYHYNIYLDYFEKDDNLGWIRGRDLEGDSIVFKYRFKPIIVKGKARGLKGTIDIDFVNFANPFSDQSDTIKYQIKIIDKALNESNLLETEEIYS
jgi:hypothetical protein